MSSDPIIETKKATIRFNGLTAVDSVNFRMAEGEAVGIIGPNGAGKTTFFNLLTGLYTPTEGAILFSGRDITKVPPYKRVALGIIRTFQLVSVFDSLPVIDNLALSTIRFGENYGSKGKFFFTNVHNERIMKVCMERLQLLGISDKADLMTSELSYGDKRKLEIAVALSLKPRILLLDEPFAGLGDNEISEVSLIINSVKTDLSLIIIEHKISRIVDMVERLCVMHEGRLIADGPPDAVLSDPTVREVYWGKEEGLTCSV
ncbi:MAG: ABC transporter ATP-binding protein [Syntrophorhabdaceae bacterium]|nr:ABC transporter ATP-binding protein [Syntrophorhabdaceae bacterium]